MISRRKAGQITDYDISEIWKTVLFGIPGLGGLPDLNAVVTAIYPTDTLDVAREKMACSFSTTALTLFQDLFKERVDLNEYSGTTRDFVKKLQGKTHSFEDVEVALEKFATSQGVPFNNHRHVPTLYWKLPSAIPK
ncbi:MAG TPA: hypothetical protein VFE94_01135 [Candidatus Paceibacterota bacterium]|nr:hypothetical protein [Candidatus Paceibacterota bacterium]